MQRVSRNTALVGGLRIDGGSRILAFEGLQPLYTARAIFNPSAIVAQKQVGTYLLGAILPIKAIVVGGFAQVNTAILGAGASVAVQIEGANDIISVAAISGAPWSTTGLKAIVPKINTPESTGIPLTANRQISFLVSAAVLTAGKVTVNLFYVMGS